MVPNVLGGEEGAEGESVEKITGGEEAGDGAHSEAGLGDEVLGDVLLLGNSVLGVPAVFLHTLERLLVFLTSVKFQKSLHPLPHSLPRLRLLLRVIDSRDGLVPNVLLSDPSELGAALPVDRVVEAGVVGLEIGAGVESAVGDEVELGEVAGEPNNIFLVEDEDLKGKGRTNLD